MNLWDGRGKDNIIMEDNIYVSKRFLNYFVRVEEYISNQKLVGKKNEDNDNISNYKRCVLMVDALYNIFILEGELKALQLTAAEWKLYDDIPENIVDRYKRDVFRTYEFLSVYIKNLDRLLNEEEVEIWESPDVSNLVDSLPF